MMNVPSYWSAYLDKGVKNLGFGSYALKILLSESCQNFSSLGFYIKTISPSTRIFVNGQKIFSHGIFAGANVGNYVNKIIPLESLSAVKELNLTVEVKNDEYRTGGFWQSIRFGNLESLHQERLFSMLLDTMMLSFLLILGLINIVLYLFLQRERGFIIFAFISLVVAYRIFVSGERLILEFFPQSSFEFILASTYLSFYVGFALLALYIYEELKSFFSRKILRAILSFAGINSLLILFLPTSYFSKLLFSYEIFAVLISIYITYVIFHSLKLNIFGIHFFGVSWIVLFIFGMADLITSQLYFHNYHFISLGLIFFAFIHTVRLSTRIARNISNMRSQSDTLLLELKSNTRHLSSSQKRLAETNEALQETENRFKSLFENSPDSITILKEKRILDCNPTTYSMFGLNREEVIGKKYYEFLPLEQESGRRSESLMRKYSAKAMRGKSQRFEWKIALLGRLIDVEIVLYKVVIAGECFLAASVRDITERKKAQSFIQLAKQIFNSSIEGLLITDRDANIVMANSTFTAITGYEEKEVLGKNPRIFKSYYHDSSFYTNLWDSLVKKDHWSGEIVDRKKNGEVYPCRMSIRTVRDPNKRVVNYISLFHDLSDIKKQEKEIHFRENYDELTGLPNFKLFMKQLGITLAKHDDNDEIAMINIGLDKFNYFNHVHGYLDGDNLLKHCAQRLKSMNLSKGYLSRTGGDRFAVYVYGLKHKDELVHFLKKLNEVMGEPCTFSEKEHFIKFSAGVTFYSNGEDEHDLYQKSYSAMMQAKKNGGSRVEFYSESVMVHISKRLQLENRLQNALHNQEIFLHYQPKVSMQKRKIIGVEALIRWMPEDLGTVKPIEFVSLLEENGLILPVGLEVFRQAVKFWRDIYEKKNISLKVAVNISPIQLRNGEIADQFNSILAEYDCPSDNIELELTESYFMDNREGLKVIQKFVESGYRIALDDFGTGYSTLAYLKDLPIHTIKIDRSFVRYLEFDGQSLVLTQMIMDIARRLNLENVIEGVENINQLKMLIESGADIIQGYFFAKPMSAPEFSDYLDKFTFPELQALS